MKSQNNSYLKVKVCGMRDTDNIRRVAELPIDMMGFIFYPKSPRYAGDMKPTDISGLPARIKKVGVFVNASIDEILEIVKRFNFQVVQLHGSESPSMCNALRNNGFEIIKAFSVATSEDLISVAEYEGVCDYYLFDTKTSAFGGSGKKFDHTILAGYSGNTPFLLSGGLDESDLENLTFFHPKLVGIDLNSRFEICPGLKDVEKLRKNMKRHTSQCTFSL